MQPLEFKNITIDELSLPMTGEAKIKVFLLRLDKIHHDISGNKWFKLKFYIVVFVIVIFIQSVMNGAEQCTHVCRGMR